MAYVYRHIRLDKNEPFYIGIGRDCKGNYTRANHGAELRRNSIIWKRIVAKTEYSVEILVDELTWEDACEKEREFIKIYGRINNSTGVLANMTDGGEGNNGLVITPEMRYKYGNAHRGKKQSESSNLKRSMALKGIKKSPEVIVKIIEANKKRFAHLPPKIKKESSRFKKGHVPSEHARKVASEFHKGKKWNLGFKHSEQSCLNMKNASKTRKSVIQYTLNREFISEYGSQREAAQKLGLKKEAIGRACKGIRGYKNNIYKGFIWRYKN